MTSTLAHRRRIRIAALTVVAALGIAVTAACTGSSGDSVSGGNQIASTEYSRFTSAVPYPFANAAPSDPLERKNLAFRLKEYNSAGSTNYVYVFTFSARSSATT